MTFADGNYVVCEDGRRVGPFSSHWAACAAMLRAHNPAFKSIGGDKAEDLETEKRLGTPPHLGRDRTGGVLP